MAGLVKEFDDKTKTISVDLGTEKALIPQSGWQWVQVSNKRAQKIFRTGDVLRVKLDRRQEKNTWIAAVEQDPGMEGALMSISPITGRVICMVGGRNFEKSQFNRCTQAVRQPGSSFKPIIYAAALDKGYTEASILIDSPIILLRPQRERLLDPFQLRPPVLGTDPAPKGPHHIRGMW